MKKLLFVLLIGFLGLFFSCAFHLDTTKERNVEGKIMAVGEGELNGFKGNYIVWQDQHGDIKLGELGGFYQIWFIFPPQELPRTPFILQLTYKCVQRFSADIVIVRVVNLKIDK